MRISAVSYTHLDVYKRQLYFFVHYPTDILGGMVLGTLDAVLAVYIVKRLEDRVDVKTISDNDKTGHK